MTSIRTLTSKLYHHDPKQRLQAFTQLLQLKKFKIYEADVKHIILLLAKKPHQPIGEWDHPRQTLLIFLKHYPPFSFSNRIIPIYSLLRAEEKSLLLELFLQWETKECLIAFFHHFKDDYNKIPVIDLFPLRYQLFYVGKYYQSLLPALYQENYRDFILYLFFELKKLDYIESEFDDVIISFISNEFPVAFKKLKEYDNDYEIAFVHGPWKNTYLPLRNHIKIMLRVMSLFSYDKFDNFSRLCLSLKDDVLVSEALINQYISTNTLDTPAAQTCCQSYEGCINFFQSCVIRSIDHEITMPFAPIHLIESQIVYRLVLVEKIPYHTLAIHFEGIEQVEAKPYYIFTFTSSESPWDSRGKLYAFCGPFTSEEKILSEINEAYTKFYPKHLTYEELKQQLLMHHNKVKTRTPLQEEYFGEFRQEVPPLYIIGLLGIISLLLIQIALYPNILSSFIYLLFIMFLSFTLLKRYKVTKTFRFVMSSNFFSYYCGKQKFKLPVEDIYQVKEEVRTVRKEESNFLNNRKKGHFLIFYNEDGKEILMVPTALVQKTYLKRILRILNINHLYF